METSPGPRAESCGDSAAGGSEPAHLAPPAPSGLRLPTRRCLRHRTASGSPRSRSCAGGTGAALEARRRVLAPGFPRRARTQPPSFPFPPGPGLPSLPWRRSRPGLFLRWPAVRGLGGRGSPVRPGARQAHKARSRRRPRGAGGRRDPGWGGPPGTLPQSQAVWTRLAPPRPRGRGPASQPKARPLGGGPSGLGGGASGLGGGAEAELQLWKPRGRGDEKLQFPASVGWCRGGCWESGSRRSSPIAWGLRLTQCYCKTEVAE